MILFKCFINFIEAFFMAIFSMKYFSLKKQNIYLPLLTTILFSIISYADFIVDDNGLGLSLLLVMALILSLMSWTRLLTFEYIYVTVLYHIFVVLINLLSFAILEFINQYVIFNDFSFTVLFCSLAKFLQVVITLYLIKMNYRFSFSLNLKQWKSIIFIMICLMAGLVFSAYAVVINSISSFLFGIISCLFFVIIVIFIYIINKVDQLNIEKMNALKQQEENKFSEKQLSMMKYLKKEIDITDHKMRYVLLQIKRCIENNRFEEAIEFINQYMLVIQKYKLVLNTGNGIFDYLYSLKINELTANGTLIETSIFIPKHSIYNEVKFINLMTKILDYFKDCKNLYVSMNGTGDMCVIQIIYRNGNVDIDSFKSFLAKSFPNKKNLINKNFDKKGVRIVINLEKYYD